MKRWAWGTLLGLIALVMLALAAGIVVAAGSPFNPADGWFYRSQRSLEDTVVSLRSSPASQARMRLELASRRLENARALLGSASEGPALAELERAMRLAVDSAARCPQADVNQLRSELLSLFEDVARALPAGVTATDEFQSWMAAATRLLRQPGLQLADLGGLSPGSPAVGVNLVLTAEPAPGKPDPSPTPLPVNPHIVYFQPGSAGAKHAFYPLIGRHLEIQCINCHPQGEYAGTGSTCETCHLQQKPASHFPGNCDLCHAPTAWTDIHFQHISPISDNCAVCHQRDKPVPHYNGQCSACHTTDAWLPAHFNHAVAGVTNCISCHAGDRPADHWSAQCSACHSTSGWLPASFNHAAAGATDCASCHRKNRPANHYNGQCSACHSTSGWLPASFNHTVAGATNCIACHRGRRPASHFDGQCSMCHSTRAWLPASFNHSFPISHGGANGQCAACHPSGSGSWTCFGCHNQAEMDSKHLEKGISDYASRCLACHAGGGSGGGD